MRHVVVILGLCLAAQLDGRAIEFTADSVRGRVAERPTVGLQGLAIDTVYSLRLSTSNTSLIYIDTVTPGSGSIARLERLSPDSGVIISFQPPLSVEQSGEFATVHLRLLAGNDTSATVYLCNRTQSGIELPCSDSLIVNIQGRGTDLPYVRFPTLEPGRPNPVLPASSIEWYYFVDRPTDIDARVYNAEGQEIEKQLRRDQRPGTGSISIDIDTRYGPGVYQLVVVTSSGVLSQKFLVSP